MSFGTIADVAIGLTLTYLMLSLITTTLQESLTSLLNTRGRMLFTGIVSLLEGKTPTGPWSAVTGQVLGHALMLPLPSGRKPSYVQARNLAAAVIDAVASGTSAPIFTQFERGLVALPAGAMKDALTVFAAKAGGDVDALQAHIETWFNDSMDRISGVYRRNAQLLAFCIGLPLAVGLNVDSLHLARTLYTSSDLRQTAVALAQARIAADAPQGAIQPTSPPAPTTVTAAANTTKLLEELGTLPIGWDCPGPSAICADKALERTCLLLACPPAKIWATIVQLGGDLAPALLGWLITAFAVSLGAPFWFDMLQRIFSLRSTGLKPVPKPSTPAI